MSINENRRFLVTVEGFQAVDDTIGAIKKKSDEVISQNARQQEQNNTRTLETIEQARSVAGIRPLGREPKAGDPAAIYRVVRGSGIVDVDWDGEKKRGETPAAVTINQLGRVAVDATYYGVEDGANVQTFMEAWRATRNGADLVLPERLKLFHTDPTAPLLFRDKKHVTVRGNGLTIEATAALGNGRWSGGLALALLEDCTFRGIKYDGRLDLRMPVHVTDEETGKLVYTDGSSDVPMNASAWNIYQYTKRVTLEHCSGVRSLMDGVCLGGSPAEFSELPPIQGKNMGHSRPTDITLRHWVSDYNLRQGISGCGFNGLLIEDAKFMNTGKTPNPDTRFRYDTKITLPGAGIDMEAYWDEGGYWNERLVMRRIEVAHNWGTGLMAEAASFGGVYEDFHIHDNGGGGLADAGAGVHSNKYRRFKIENNLAGEDHKPAVGVKGEPGYKPAGRFFASEESHEVGAFYPDFTLTDSTIRTRRGVGGIKAMGDRTTLENVTVYAADATSKEQNGIVRVYGADPTLRNVRVVNGQGRTEWSSADRSAIFVEQAPLQIVDCRAENTLADTVTTRGILARKRGKLARGNTASGYAVPVDINTPGEVITLGDAMLLDKDGNPRPEAPVLRRGGDLPLLPDIVLGKKLPEVLVSSPDRLLLRFRETLGWSRGADTQFGIINLNLSNVGLTYKIVNVYAGTNYGRDLAPAVILSGTAYFTVPAGSGNYRVEATVYVEIVRH